MSNEYGPTYLFSVDLEDVRTMIPNGMQYPDRVEEMTRMYLDFLDKTGSKCTFFTVGNVLRSNSNLVEEIVNRGHEIAYHTDNHVPLPEQGDDGFRKDLDTYLNTCKQLQLPKPIGFRAPTFSMTNKTQWAYSILSEYGFTYSSSVLPAKNPLFGWKTFGETPKRIGNLVELPMTLGSLGPVKIPFGGGVYFRVLPTFLIHQLFRQNVNKDILGYFHPYDIDTEQDRFMHPGLNNSWFYNQVMYLGRNSVFSKIESVLNLGYSIKRYDQFVQDMKL